MNLIERHTLCFYRRDCTHGEVLSNDVRYVLVGADGFPWNDHPASQHRATYRARFREGGRAMIGTIDDAVVFTAWLADRALRVDELRCTWRPPPGSIVVYDVVTEPAWRGRGIYPEALRRVGVALAEEGMQHLWIYAEAGNTASRGGIVKAGFGQVGCVDATILLGVAITRGDFDRIPGLPSGCFRVFGRTRRTHRRRVS